MFIGFLVVPRTSWDKPGCVFWVSAKIEGVLRLFQGLRYEKDEHLCT